MAQNDIQGEYTDSSASKSNQELYGSSPTSRSSTKEGDVHLRFQSLIDELKAFLEGEGSQLPRDEVANALGHLSAIGIPAKH